MKIAVILISIFVLFNVLKYQSTKYLLVDVEDNDFESGNPVGK